MNEPVTDRELLELAALFEEWWLECGVFREKSEYDREQLTSRKLKCEPGIEYWNLGTDDAWRDFQSIHTFLRSNAAKIGRGLATNLNAGGSDE